MSYYYDNDFNDDNEYEYDIDLRIDEEEKILDLCKNPNDTSSLYKIKKIYNDAKRDHFILFIGKQYRDEPYKTACQHKHYDALEWLLTHICQNVTHQVERIYYHCALRFEIDSAQWLIEKYPFFETTLVINWLHPSTITQFHQYKDSLEVWETSNKLKKFRVRRKQEMKWYRYKHALMLAKNKNCILYHLPNEILRYLVQSFL